MMIKKTNSRIEIFISPWKKHKSPVIMPPKVNPGIVLPDPIDRNHWGTPKNDKDESLETTYELKTISKNK